MEICDKFERNIQLVTGAHVHRTQMMSPHRDNQETSKKLPMLVTSSISPSYNNNPTYSTMEIFEEHKISGGKRFITRDFQFHSF